MKEPIELSEEILVQQVSIQDELCNDFIENLILWFDTEVTEYFKSQCNGMRPGDKIFYTSQVKQYKESFLTQLESREISLKQLLEMKQMFINQCTAIYQVVGKPTDLQIKLNSQFDDIITSVKLSD